MYRFKKRSIVQQIYERCSTFQKVIVCIFAAMAVIFAIWTAISRTNEGVVFHETLLKVTTRGDTTVYRGRLYGTPVTITSREENGTKLVNFSADGAYYADCRVEYPGGTIQTEFGSEVSRIKIIRNDEVLFSGGYDPDPKTVSYAHYYSEDGTWDTSFMLSISAGGIDPWSSFEFDISDIMRFAHQPGLSAYGSWAVYFLALIVSVFCAFMTIFPDEIFYLEHVLSVHNPEPTDFYYFMHKVGSVICVILIFITYVKGIAHITA